MRLDALALNKTVSSWLSGGGNVLSISRAINTCGLADVPKFTARSFALVSTRQHFEKSGEPRGVARLNGRLEICPTPPASVVEAVFGMV